VFVLLRISLPNSPHVISRKAACIHALLGKIVQYSDCQLIICVNSMHYDNLSSNILTTGAHCRHRLTSDFRFDTGFSFYLVSMAAEVFTRWRVLISFSK